MLPPYQIDLTSQRRVLPADVYDALEASVLAAGGAVWCGPGSIRHSGRGCLLSHAAFLDGVSERYNLIGWADQPPAETPVLAAVWRAFDARHAWDVYIPNDDACAAKPLTWAEYTAALNIVREDADA